MNRYSWRTCCREAGFSFVELLVTIVLAGIIFAAMVPVFAGALKKTTGGAQAAHCLTTPPVRAGGFRMTARPSGAR